MRWSRRPHPARPRARVVVVGALALLGASVLVRGFVRPPADEPVPSDAIVVLSGSSVRLAHALELMEQGLAPTLALSNGDLSALARERGLCTRAQPFDVICFRPTRQSTAGEARTIASLSAEHGWQAVTVVTSTYHVTRARQYIRQCYDGQLAVVAAGVGEHLGAHLRHLVREPLGVLAAVTINRACR